MNRNKEKISLDHLSKPERHVLSLIAIQGSAGRAAAFADLEKIFGSAKEAQARLDCMVALGLIRRTKGGFRLEPAAQEEMERIASEERQRQSELLAAYGPLQAKYPGHFLALRGGELFDRDLDFKALLGRIAPVRAQERLTIVPPLRG